MSEAELIGRILDRCPTVAPGVLTGPGDDAAVFELDGRMVTTTDSLVEEVHFRREWLSPADLGWKLVGVNLSDLAAMAAAPHTALLSLVGGASDYPVEFAEGLGDALRSAGLALIGGNVSGSPGPMMLTLTLNGLVDRPVLRSGARPGDGLWVSGPLGLAGSGLAALMAGRPEDDPEGVRAWRRPPDRVERARTARAMVTALMDLSDGLAADLPRLCAASGVGAEVQVQAVPGREGFKLSAGEDYELLATAPPEADFAPGGWTRIGEIRAGRHVRFVDARGERVEPGLAFDHLRTS